MHMSDGAVEAINTLSQDVQAAQREAAQQAQQTQQQAQQQAQRELQQAQREVQQAQREAQQAQQEAQREAQQAQREAQQAVREAQLELARRVGRPVQVAPSPPFPPGGPQIPEGAVVISIAFFVMCAVIAIGVPLVRAFTRRMDRRNTAAPIADAETRDRLERIEEAVHGSAGEGDAVLAG